MSSHSGGDAGPQPASHGTGGAGDDTAGVPPEMRSFKARIVTRLFHTWFVVNRAMTLGVRAACFDGQGRLFLVRHSYVPGWHMPGGGVERGQTAEEALHRELAEEGNLTMLEAPELFAVYFNPRTSRRDHVVFYRCLVRQDGPKLPDREIVETGFFHPRDLPEGTTAATRRRVEEVLGGPVDPIW